MPISIFSSDLSLSDLESVFSSAPGFVLPALGAEVWKQVAENSFARKWIVEATELAKTEAFQPLPTMSDELYASFCTTGQRLPFERIYFERRRILARAALVVLLGEPSDAERLESDFIEKLRGIFAEDSWALPAHVDHPSGKDPLVIDLFAAETANLMAEMLQVFGAIIPSDLAASIRARLRTQIFENYLSRHEEFAWFSAGMNWNAVCHQGVLGAALTAGADTRLLARMFLIARKGLPHFLAGFGEDGSTSEGPGYWQYGFGWFAELNAQLEARTQRALSLFEGNLKIERIAHFAPQLALRNGYLVNFSDNDRRGIIRPSLLSYLGERLGSPVLQNLGRHSFQHLAATGIDWDGERSDFFQISRLLVRTPDLAKSVTAIEDRDVFFQDYGAVIARGEDRNGNYWEFAAKAGHNGEHHNHNDCGSFILHVNSSPIVIEIGAPEYVRGFFGDERNTFLAARSSGHSVPVVNGFEQAAGREYSAYVIECVLETNRVRFVIDLTHCYPPEANCKRLIRTFVLDKGEGCLTISDQCEFEGHGAMESIIICEAPVELSGRSARINTPGRRMCVTAMDAANFREVDAPAYRNRDGQPRVVHRIRMVPSELGGSITFQIHPALG